MLYFDAGMRLSSFAMEFSESEIQAVADILARNLPPEAMPVCVGRDESGSAVVALSGIQAKGCGVGPITQLIRDLCVISEMIPRKRQGREVYIFGTPPLRHLKDRLLSTWACSPEEAVAKLLVSLAPGLSRDPGPTIRSNPFATGPIEMRCSFDMTLVAIEPALARARELLSGGQV